MIEKIDIKDGVHVRSWCKDIERNTMGQITDVAKHPCAFSHVAIMPDAHFGFGVPIGSVVALRGAVSPAMVGVDIGCGMRAVKTSIKIETIDEFFLEELKEKIKRVVPVGMSHRQKEPPNNFPFIKCFNTLSGYSAEFSNNYMKSVTKSMGTLGGGNHFIEVQVDDDGYLWIMIHSGSRNFGKRIADHWNGIAMADNSAFCSSGNNDAKDLAFLPLENTTYTHGHEYIVAMEYALEYAKENRRVMMQLIKDEIHKIVKFGRMFELDIHHNYASHERHFGKDVWVHRKGATSARAGELGIIPGSMGTNSYIVEGLGNYLSFNSCSHGAGRCHSRTGATLHLDAQLEQEKMANIVSDGFKINARGTKKTKGLVDLGEAPGAYKNIDDVMENQSDLVKIHTKLTPLMVVKG